MTEHVYGRSRPMPVGLCGERGDHLPHVVLHAAVANGAMWCHADQSKRLPFALEYKEKGR